MDLLEAWTHLGIEPTDDPAAIRAAYLARLILENIFTGVLTLGGWLGQGFSVGLRRLQTGKAHQYAIAMLLVIFALAFWLGGR